MVAYFFFQAEDGIRDLVRSRGLGDVYKRQKEGASAAISLPMNFPYSASSFRVLEDTSIAMVLPCLLYTSDAADDLLCVDLGGRRILKKKNK